MLFTDTDSLTYECLKQKDLFEFSNFPKSSNFFDETYKKVIGKMKDVSEGKITDEFFGLKSKMYSMKCIDGKENNTAKGVNIATEFNEFKDTLFNKKILRHKVRTIQTKRHKPGTCEINKTSLSCFDYKRSVSKNGIPTPTYFHKDLRKKRVLIKKKRFSQIKRIQKIFIK